MGAEMAKPGHKTKSAAAGNATPEAITAAPAPSETKMSFIVFICSLTLKLSRIAARSWQHGKLFLPC
jgi:hypothetical protein